MEPAPRAPRSSGARTGLSSWSQLRKTSLVTAFLSREAALLAAEAAAMTQQLRRTIAENSRRPAFPRKGRPRKKS